MTDAAVRPPSGRGGEPSERFVGAVLDTVPLPAFAYGGGGELLHANVPARRLFAGSDELMPDTIVTSDGMALWLLIVSEATAPGLVVDVRARLRLADGRAADCVMAVTPVRGASDQLGGALVFVKDMPRERLERPHHASLVGRSDAGDATVFVRLAEYAAALTGADYLYIAEVDVEAGANATVLAAWDGGPVGPYEFPFGGTPVTAFAGRRLVRVPAGLREAYPEDEWFRKHGFEAFVGCALTDSAGKRIGVISALWTHPLEEAADVSAVLRVVAEQASEALSALRTRRDLLESEGRHTALFETSALPILLVEPESSQVVESNPAAARFYGYERDELCSMSVFQLDEAEPDRVKAQLLGVLSGTREIFSGRHRRFDGAVRDVEVTAGPIVVRGRRLVFLTVHDVTERHVANEALKQAKAELERMVAERTRDLLRANSELQREALARDMVLASLSRELRTSLQTVVGFSEIMLQGLAGPITDEQERQLAMVHEAGEHLAGVLSGLLEAAHGPTGEERGGETVDVVALTESVVFSLRALTEDARLDLLFEAAERPLLVEKDRYRVQQTLLSLFALAMRCTREGSSVSATVSRRDGGVEVSIRAATVRLDEDDVAALVAARDDGADSTVGLTASRRAASEVDGTIEVDEPEGGALVFTLRLPGIASPERPT